jgi:hypothetical protein
MKSTLTLIALVASLLTASPVLAETDEERLIKLLEKNGVVEYTFAEPPLARAREVKAACVCLESTFLYRAGYLVHFPFDTQRLVQCVLPDLDVSGTASIEWNCGGSFAVIGRYATRHVLRDRFETLAARRGTRQGPRGAVGQVSRPACGPRPRSTGRPWRAFSQGGPRRSSTSRRPPAPRRGPR